MKEAPERRRGGRLEISTDFTEARSQKVVDGWILWSDPEKVFLPQLP